MSEKNQSITVLGAGAYGTAIARSLAFNGHDVILWCHSTEHAQALSQERENQRRLPGISLPQNLHTEADIQRACTGRDALIFAVPSLYLVDVLRRVLGLEDVIEAVPRIASVTKGFIPGRDGRGNFVLETMERYLPGAYTNRLVYISGPSHAEEMGRDILTGLVCASKDGKNALWFRNLFQGPSLMTFPSLDTIGVQVSAAVKNVIAIAFGILDALKEIDPLVGDNTESLLFAAGLNEIQTLGTALGATHPETFTSIAGVGDLDVTCHSVHGRNRRFGRQIVLKGILEQFTGIEDLITRINEVGYLPEGVPATKYAAELAHEKSLKLPLIQRIFAILDRKMEPLELIDSFRAT
ncbi:MAG: NAD(P)-dependent glycerol-3-phosphate dehydrogenase [Spirochaetales bacterium]|nr:NAD(P)-dependent glycerol-3-phosphate dehydrogenase [Spirochaetales bacterium]